MRVSLQFLVDAMRAPGDVPRTFTVEHALPPDTQLVGWTQLPHPTVPGSVATITLLLESDSWLEDSDEVVEPVATVSHYVSLAGRT